MIAFFSHHFYLLLLLFAPVVVLGSALQSRISGWAALASRFPATDIPEGEQFRFVSGSVGAAFPSSYRGILFVTVSATGFALSIFLPFRFCAPNLFIPWSQVEAVTEKPAFLYTLAEIHIRGSRTRISLFGASARSILQAYAPYATNAR